MTDNKQSLLHLLTQLRLMEPRLKVTLLPEGTTAWGCPAILRFDDLGTKAHEVLEAFLNEHGGLTFGDRAADGSELNDWDEATHIQTFLLREV